MKKLDQAITVSQFLFNIYYNFDCNSSKVGSDRSASHYRSYTVSGITNTFNFQLLLLMIMTGD